MRKERKMKTVEKILADSSSLIIVDPRSGVDSHENVPDHSSILAYMRCRKEIKYFIMYL